MDTGLFKRCNDNDKNNPLYLICIKNWKETGPPKWAANPC